MTSQCSIRPIWHAWTNLRARGHTTGRLRALHTQESLCGSSQHRRCSNRSRFPGRASCTGTTAGLPRPIIVRPRKRVEGPRTRAAPDAPHGRTATSHAAPAEPPHPSSGCHRWLPTAARHSGTTAARAPQVCHGDAHAVVNWRATARGGGGELHLGAWRNRRENGGRDLLGRRPATR